MLFLVLQRLGPLRGSPLRCPRGLKCTFPAVFRVVVRRIIGAQRLLPPTRQDPAREMHGDKQVIWSDLKLKVNIHLEQLWQTDWDTDVDNKLHEIRPNPKERLVFDERMSRKQETVVSRLRIGHSWITHEYLLKGEQQPYCTDCECPITVKHILVECADFLLSRQKIIRRLICIHYSEW
ncbi:RNA-directed DNA polymerase from transposon X-element [Elysia marginata]|uniref:RNA-directed DNA polymerase from transposon X-element n=1 Tax=Elysia marginata TaxID=1093978 RepID=A0AAV4K1J1_9GAST|nr:RNA-directed DNA polymerase from transposon X-element [Elysia marginata]